MSFNRGVLVAALGVQALLASHVAQAEPIAWTSQTYNVWLDSEAVDRSNLVQDLVVYDTSGLPLSGSLGNSGLMSVVSDSGSISFDGTYYHSYIEQSSRSVGGGLDYYGSGMVNADLTNYFVATQSTLYLTYRFEGTLNLRNQSTSMAYSDVDSDFAVIDLDVFGPGQYGRVVYSIADQNTPGAIERSFAKSDVVAFALIPGHRYEVYVDNYRDVLTTGTSSGDGYSRLDYALGYEPAAIPVASPVPEPSQAALLALGLLPLMIAGTKRRAG